MADITDIRTIMYTEKSLSLKEGGVLVVQASKRMTKNRLKEIFKEYFNLTPVSVNSLRQPGKAKSFRGVKGQRVDFKKFYVKVPEGADIEALSV